MLLLSTAGVVREPILYLSLFFKTHRSLYYEHLQAVRTHGAREEWLKFSSGVPDSLKAVVT